MRKHNYSQVLIFAAIGVTMARYMGAFLASDMGRLEGAWSEFVTILTAMTGLGMGILDVLGSAYIFDGWRRQMPRAGQRWPFRFNVLTFWVMALFLTGIGILVPFTVSRVTHQSMEFVLGLEGVWGWGIAVNLAPYLLIGGVVTAQTGVVTVESSPTQTVVSLPTAVEPNTRIPHGKRYDYLKGLVLERAKDGRSNGDVVPSAVEIAKLVDVSERMAFEYRKRLLAEISGVKQRA